MAKYKLPEDWGGHEIDVKVTDYLGNGVTRYKLANGTMIITPSGGALQQVAVKLAEPALGSLVLGIRTVVNSYELVGFVWYRSLIPDLGTKHWWCHDHQQWDEWATVLEVLDTNNLAPRVLEGVLQRISGP